MEVSKKSQLITIKEFESITREEQRDEYKYLPVKSFDALECFVLANKDKVNKDNPETDAFELLKLSTRKGVGKVISAKNYVGVITLKDGITIEILPKIAGVGANDDETKKIFLKMLKTLKDSPFKEFNTSNLKTQQNMNVLEIFIKMFLGKVSMLTRQGLKSAYIETEENEKFYKGKLLVSQNIRYNIANKERFFVRYDEFSINRPENRLIKSALKYLQGQTREQANSNEVIKLLSHFENVDFSSDYDTDFSKVSVSRAMKNYADLMNWCKIFLKKNSFTAFAGSEKAIALLFPMEKIFESYVAAMLKKYSSQEFDVSTQDSGHHLFDDPKKFCLRPDVVLTSKNEKKTIILDTKWKLLKNEERSNYGISQGDMYQMYAYAKKYKAYKIVLLYPKTEDNMEIPSYIANDNDKKVIVDVKFINLKNIINSTDEENEFNRVLAGLKT